MQIKACIILCPIKWKRLESGTIQSVSENTDAVDYDHFGKQFRNNLNKVKDVLPFNLAFPVLDAILEKLLKETCL